MNFSGLYVPQHFIIRHIVQRERFKLLGDRDFRFEISFEFWLRIQFYNWLLLALVYVDIIRIPIERHTIEINFCLYNSFILCWILFWGSVRAWEPFSARWDQHFLIFNWINANCIFLKNCSEKIEKGQEKNDTHTTSNPCQSVIKSFYVYFPSFFVIRGYCIWTAQHSTAPDRLHHWNNKSNCRKQRWKAKQCASMQCTHTHKLDIAHFHCIIK